MRFPLTILTVFCYLLAASCVRGQIPSEIECLDSLEAVGIASLQASLTPCAFGASDTCCTNLDELVGLDTDAEFSGCLCNQGVLDVIVEEIDGNTLAQSVGFTGERLIEVFSTCETPIYGTPACPAPAPPLVEMPTVVVETDAVTVVPSDTVDAEVDVEDELEDALDEGPEIEDDAEENAPSTLRVGLMSRRFSKRERNILKLREEEDEGLMGRKKKEYKKVSKKKQKGFGKLKKKASTLTDIDIPDPEDSTTFEDARAKIEVMLNNLKNTRDIITDSALNKKKTILDDKASSTAWTDYEYQTPVLKNGEVVKLVPVRDDDTDALERALPVRIDRNVY